MKLTACLLFGLAVLTAAPASTQLPPRPLDTEAALEPRLTKFDLDFPGGTPAELVAAIQKATGKPLNAIIRNDYIDRQLPALKMTGVDVARLFEAMIFASRHTLSYSYPSPDGKTTNSREYDVHMGFRTNQAPHDDAVWYFYAEEPPAPPQSSRFYLLSSYLDRGLTVDDITTAIQTAWKMQGDKGNLPKVSFHKETKLLIAAGEAYRLETIDQVLKVLDGPESKTISSAPKSTGGEEKKP